MIYGEGQKEEIQTIRERTITVKLSDADCQRLAEKAAEAGETIDSLMEGFIGDLVDGTYTHGSDEVDCAQRWFERSYLFTCQTTFLSYLIQYGEVNEIIERLSDIEDMKKDIAIFKEELKTGELASGGTWEDLETHSLGVVKPAYSSKEEWELSQRHSIEQAEAYIQDCETIINDYWIEYKQDWKVPDADIHREIDVIKEWSKQLENFKGIHTGSYDAAVEEALKAAEPPEPDVGMEI